MIGLSGAHRTGKTTLARAFAQKHKLEFVETPTSSIFKEMGLDPSVTYDFSTRLMIQEEILKRCDALYAQHSRADMSIADRTPLDFLGYTMAEAVGDSVSEADQERFDWYVRDCFDVLNRRFSTILVVQPGIDIVPAEGKAAPNAAYIEHLNSLILGLSVDERLKTPHFYMPRHLTDLKSRIGALGFAVDRVRERARLESQESVLH